jgi:peroxiredoxin Q/BCP
MNIGLFLTKKMKMLLWTGLIAVFIVGAALYIRAKRNEKTPLAIGDKIPPFSLKNQFGEIIRSKDIVGKQNLVIYFYPKDNTPGCTKEACSFRDSMDEFSELDAMVLGISSDSEASHSRFSTRHSLNFSLLSDPDQKVRNAFGVNADFAGLIPGRVTYVIDRKGVIQSVFNSQGNIEKHVQNAKETLKYLE